MKFRASAASALLATAGIANALQLDIQDDNSIKAAAKTIAEGMLDYYLNQDPQYFIPGLLNQNIYYWWEAGAMFGSLIDYWYYTGDDSYNDIVTKAMLFQVGNDDNYMPQNQTASLGNDDQAFWGMAAMSAAEQKYPNPPNTEPQWLALAQAVFNSQALRWDLDTCGGGLRWQIFTFNQGYNYKNSISNGAFFNLAARIGFYTKNDTYFEWADRAWDWTTAIGLIDNAYKVFDGTDVAINCTRQNHIQWTYNTGVYLLGAAVMWNVTEGDDARQAEWETRIRGLLTASDAFFKNDVMFEAACEPRGNCNTDQQSFKAYLSRWMAASTKFAPFVYDLVSTKLATSAQAAAQQCNGGTDGVTCGTKWTQPTWDGTYGVGQQMNALEVIQGMLIKKTTGPVSNNTGGISRGDPSAGTGGDTPPGTPTGRITTGDKAGAGILTALVLIGLLGGAW